MQDTFYAKSDSLYEVRERIRRVEKMERGEDPDVYPEPNPVARGAVYGTIYTLNLILGIGIFPLFLIFLVAVGLWLNLG